MGLSRGSRPARPSQHYMDHHSKKAGVSSAYSSEELTREGGEFAQQLALMMMQARCMRMRGRHTGIAQDGDARTSPP